MCVCVCVCVYVSHRDGLVRLSNGRSWVIAPAEVIPNIIIKLVRTASLLDMQ